MKLKKFTAVVLAAALSLSIFAGCGLDKNATVATFSDGTTVSLGLANYLCHYQQAYVEDMYVAYYGDDAWNTDNFGTGSTPGDQAKTDVMEQLHEYYTLAKPANMEKYGVQITEDDKKAISEAAAKYIADNSAESNKETGATQEIIEEMLTLMTISERMNDAIKAEADTEVSDEEANMRGYTIVEIARTQYNDGSQYVEYTDEEKVKAEEDAKAFVESLATQDMSAAATYNGYELKTDAYGADDETLPEEVKTALDGMKVGEISDLIYTDDFFYVVRLDSETDEEATEKKKESIISSRQSDHYDEVIAALQADDGWTVDEKLLAKIKYENRLTTSNPDATTTESADTADTTEHVDTTESADVTESVETTEAQ